MYNCKIATEVGAALELQDLELESWACGPYTLVAPSILGRVARVARVATALYFCKPPNEATSWCAAQAMRLIASD